jgi:hypothetical protein
VEDAEGLGGAGEADLGEAVEEFNDGHWWLAQVGGLAFDGLSGLGRGRRWRGG